MRGDAVLCVGHGGGLPLNVMSLPAPSLPL